MARPTPLLLSLEPVALAIGDELVHNFNRVGVRNLFRVGGDLALLLHLCDVGRPLSHALRKVGLFGVGRRRLQGLQLVHGTQLPTEARDPADEHTTSKCVGRGHNVAGLALHRLGGRELDGEEVLGVVDHVVDGCHGTGEVGPHAEAAKILGMDTRGHRQGGTKGLAVDPVALHLLQAHDLIVAVVALAPQALQDDLTLELPALDQVHRVLA
mmetsp:Transcript_5697/g.18260  ORF Transcript_5697/g.18260 Transcript_5697/m.18260 type:complete len:212 (+) Transcript_5697:34-669(+)